MPKYELIIYSYEEKKLVVIIAADAVSFIACPAEIRQAQTCMDAWRHAAEIQQQL